MSIAMLNESEDCSYPIFSRLVGSVASEEGRCVSIIPWGSTSASGRIDFDCSDID